MNKPLLYILLLPAESAIVKNSVFPNFKNQNGTVSATKTT